MRAPRRFVPIAAAALLACGGTTEIASDGRILVTVNTVGEDPQSPEYLLSLDGRRATAVAPNGSAVFDGVEQGTHVVHLFALSDNCAVSGSTSPRSVRVGGGDVIEVVFSVVCAAPETGGFRVVVTTSGAPVDDDGYQLSVAGTPSRPIEVNAEEAYDGLEPGPRLITLKDVADFCDVVGGNPQRHTVVRGKAVRVSIGVTCGGGGAASLSP